MYNTFICSPSVLGSGILIWNRRNKLVSCGLLHRSLHTCIGGAVPATFYPILTAKHQTSANCGFHQNSLFNGNNALNCYRVQRKKRARKWVEIRGRCRVDKCVLCRIPKGQLGQSHYHNQKKKTEKMQNGVHINEKYSRKKQKKNFLALESNDFRCLDSRGILNRQSRK